MRYRILDVEATAPLPEVSLAPDETGIALVVRVGDRPVSFSLHDMDAGAALGRAEVERLVAEAGGAALLEEAIRHELTGETPAPGPADVTAVVCTRDRPRLAARCLESILAVRAADPHRRGLPVLVVDNAPSDDGTRDLVAPLEGVRYAREPRPGLDFARNRALAEAGSEWVAFVDDDAVVDRGWLAGLDEAVAENPDAGLLTGAVLPLELETEAQILFERRGGFRRGFDKLRYHGDRHPDIPLYPAGAGVFGAGANMVVRRELVRSLGGFDEALDTGPPLPGGGDLDIFYRVVRAGHPLVYEPRLLVFHEHRRDLEGLRRQSWTWGTGFMAYVWKSYATDPAERRKLRHLVGWWLGDEVRQLALHVKRRNAAGRKLAAAELAGGIAGLAGASYPRSARRSRAIREEHR